MENAFDVNDTQEQSRLAKVTASKYFWLSVGVAVGLATRPVIRLAVKGVRTVAGRVSEIIAEEEVTQIEQSNKGSNKAKAANA